MRHAGKICGCTYLSLSLSFSSKYIAVIINPLLNYVEVFWRSVILPSSRYPPDAS